jgi:hypothetical protein
MELVLAERKRCVAMQPSTIQLGDVLAVSLSLPQPLCDAGSDGIGNLFSFFGAHSTPLKGSMGRQ